MVNFLELLRGKISSSLLEFFIGNYDREFFLAEILRITGLSKPNVIKALNSFVKAGILNKYHREKTFYILNASLPFIRYLKISCSLSLFYPEILDFTSKADIFLYGSSAEGIDTYKSDFDLLIIGNASRREAEGIINTIRNKTKRKISYVLFTNMEWSKLAREDKPFFERIEKTKIRLV